MIILGCSGVLPFKETPSSFRVVVFQPPDSIANFPVRAAAAKGWNLDRALESRNPAVNSPVEVGSLSHYLQGLVHPLPSTVGFPFPSPLPRMRTLVTLRILLDMFRRFGGDILAKHAKPSFATSTGKGDNPINMCSRVAFSGPPAMVWSPHTIPVPCVCHLLPRSAACT